VIDARRSSSRLFRPLMKWEELLLQLIVVSLIINVIPRLARVEPHSESSSLKATHSHLRIRH
jgi:hypothetical protein